MWEPFWVVPSVVPKMFVEDMEIELRRGIVEGVGGVGRGSRFIRLRRGAWWH